MITQILRALNTWLDRQNDRDQALLAASRHFMIDLSFASKQHADNPEAMAAIAQIAESALKASERSDLKALKNATAAMREFVA